MCGTPHLKTNYTETKKMNRMRQRQRSRLFLLIPKMIQALELARHVRVMLHSLHISFLRAGRLYVLYRGRPRRLLSWIAQWHKQVFRTSLRPLSLDRWMLSARARYTEQDLVRLVSTRLYNIYMRERYLQPAMENLMLRPFHSSTLLLLLDGPLCVFSEPPSSL